MNGVSNKKSGVEIGCPNTFCCSIVNSSCVLYLILSLVKINPITCSNLVAFSIGFFHQQLYIHQFLLTIQYYQYHIALKYFV